MKKKLIKEIVGVQATDELIKENKKYQSLCEDYDRLDAILDDSMNLTKGELKVIEQMRDQIYNKMRAISVKAQESVFLSRMIRGAMALKALK